MSDKKTPDWLKYDHDQGHADITLSRPMTVDGTKVPAIRMREPTVNDQLVGDTVQGGPAHEEVAIFANLVEIPPADVRGLPLRDYKRLQVAFTGFID